MRFWCFRHDWCNSKHKNKKAAMINALLLLVFAALFLQCFKCAPVYIMKNIHKTANGHEADMYLQQGTSGPYGGDSEILRFQVFYYSENVLRFKISDAKNKRFEVPSSLSDIPNPSPVYTGPAPNYEVEFGNGEGRPFSFRIRNKLINDYIFDSANISPVFEPQYVSLTTNLKNFDEHIGPNIYGLGERIHAFRLDPNHKKYTIFNQDHGNDVDSNLYGYHPFFVQQLNSGSAFGAFYHSSYAMDVAINWNQMEFIAIGGNLDFFFYMGPTPKDVVKQHQDVIGKPMMPPFWALGYHQSRWGYKTIDETAEVVENYLKNHIPLESITNDIDYMDQKKLYTTDPVNYPLQKVKAFVDALHAKNMKYIVIVDPGVKEEKGYEMYDDAISKKLYIQTADRSGPIINTVWPGRCVFPDFVRNKDVPAFWEKFTRKFYDDGVKFDGLWIDMNEIASFCDGDMSGRCDGFQWLPEKLAFYLMKYPLLAPKQTIVKQAKQAPARIQNKIDYNHPPYVPGGESLVHKTLSMDAWTNDTLYYETKTLYAYAEAKITKKILEKMFNKRAFTLSRATWSSHGHIGFHWLGDNFSTFESMYQSITGMLSMNLFGIPFVGADIGGFIGSAWKDLIVRWHQLGLFYTWSRNHNCIGQPSQEVYQFDKETQQICTKYITMKYTLLNYFYTALHHANTRGEMVHRSMNFEYPKDPAVVMLDKQFFTGPALLLGPVLEDKATTKVMYFPDDVFFDYYTGAKVNYRKEWATIPAPLSTMPLFMKNGQIIVRQEPSMTTTGTRDQSFELLISYFEENSFKPFSAKGDLYYDDGESIDPLGTEKFSYISFEMLPTPGKPAGAKLNSVISAKGYHISSYLKKITIYGLGLYTKIDKVYCSGHQVSFTLKTNGVVEINDLSLDMNEPLDITFTYSQ